MFQVDTNSFNSICYVLAQSFITNTSQLCVNDFYNY